MRPAVGGGVRSVPMLAAVARRYLDTLTGPRLEPVWPLPAAVDSAPVFRTCTLWASSVIFCLSAVRLLGVQRARSDRIQLDRSQWVWTIDVSPSS